MPRETDVVVVLVRRGTEVASWPLAESGRPRLAVVDALGRLQLAARRLGCAVHLRHPCEELCELLDLVGLTGIVTRPPAHGGTG